MFPASAGMIRRSNGSWGSSERVPRQRGDDLYEHNYLQFDDWETCLGRSGSKVGEYVRIVRVNLKLANRRIFTPTPWGRCPRTAASLSGECWSGSTPGWTGSIDSWFTAPVVWEDLDQGRPDAGDVDGAGQCSRGMEERARPLVRPFPLADTG